jgi:gas vesicle protein
MRDNDSFLLLRRTTDLQTKAGGVGIRRRMGVEMQETKWQGAASGLLIGIGVGVALGMLLAPKSGKQTRDEIVGTVKDGLDGAIAKGQDLTRRVQQTLDDAGERVKDAAEAGEHAYRQAKSVAS